MKTMGAILALLMFSMVASMSSMASAENVKRAKDQKLEAQTEHLHALKQASKGDVKGAIRALQVLAAKPMPKAELDRVELSTGRLQYEAGQFDQAIESFSKVQKTGASWLEALEETAWAQFRVGRPQETIARLKTLTSIAFKDEVRSEPFFLMGLAELRVCDYKSVFKTIDLFKSRFSNLTKALEKDPSTRAQARVKEIGDTVQKLNLVEAEVIQRLYVDANGKKRSGSVSGIPRTQDEISFPATEDDELWLDEVDGYKVALKGCAKPAPKPVANSSSGKSATKVGGLAQ